VRKPFPGKKYRFLNGEPPRGVFALPSLGEGVSLTYLEAMASGVLTLGTNTTGSEFLNPTNSIIIETGPPVRNLALELEHTLYRGMPFPSVRVSTIGEALKRAYNMSDKERDRVTATARKQVESFTYDNCAKQIVSVIEEHL
jgi:glycosyltransferase involved in cell wall biosynthesis